MSQDIVVIGASAGGLEALTTVTARLPPTLPASLLVVMHTRASSNGFLPDILARSSALPVAFAQDGDPVTPGRIYVARPDLHLLIEKDRLRVVHGPTENGFRPAVDPLFRTAARAFGRRVVGIVLSGALSDGTYGLSVIKEYGGTAIVQDPDEAMIGSMPRSAIQAVDVDHVVPAAEIAALIEQLSQQEAEGEDPMVRSQDLEPQLPSEENAVSQMVQRFGHASALTCPNCGGALWEVKEGRVLRYQCHVGHQYGEDSLEAGQREAVDSALWSAVRVLEEHADLKKRMARRSAAAGLTSVSTGFEAAAQDAHRQAQEIRALLFAMDTGNEALHVEEKAKQLVERPVKNSARRAGAARAVRRRAAPGKRQRG